MRWSSLSISSAAMAIAMAASAAHGQQLADAFTFKNLTYAQSGAGGSDVTSTGAFFNAGADLQNPGDFDSVTLTYPGPGSPVALPQTSPTSFGIGPGFASQADMDAAFPMGDYVITATGAGSPDVETLHYTTDAYAQNVPVLEAASYDALQGLNTSQSSLDLAFNAQQASSDATSSFTFFSIGDSTGLVETCGFLSPSATTCEIDPHLLQAGTTYSYELDFSNRIESNTTGTLDGVDFDVRTDGTFTTAVPEPATWAMMLMGIGGLGAAMRSRRKGLVAAA